MTFYSFRSQNNKCSGTVKEQDGIIYVNGRCLTNDTKLKYLAASPPDLRKSYMGAGLPFANPEMAYEETPNKGEVSLNTTGHFEIVLVQPNSYYVNNGKDLISPHVHVTVGSDYFDIPLGQGVINRSLSSFSDRINRSTGR